MLPAPHSPFAVFQVADAVAQALVKIGTAKPKFPLLDAPRSALLALALELRAANPRTNGTELGPAYVERKTKYAEACQVSNRKHNNKPQSKPLLPYFRRSLVCPSTWPVLCFQLRSDIVCVCLLAPSSVR